MKDFMSRVDTELLREQRDALFVAIDDADYLAQYGERDFHTSPLFSKTQKQITMLEGLVNMIDAMLEVEEEQRKYSKHPKHPKSGV